MASLGVFKGSFSQLGGMHRVRPMNSYKRSWKGDRQRAQNLQIKIQEYANQAHRVVNALV
jgi:hypothetical protein